VAPPDRPLSAARKEGRSCDDQNSTNNALLIAVFAPNRKNGEAYTTVASALFPPQAKRGPTSEA